MSEGPPKNTPEKDGTRKESSKVDKFLSKVRDALNLLLTEEKDLDSAPRYMIARPIRQIMAGGPEEADRKMEEAYDVVGRFLRLTGEPFPKGRKGKEVLLQRLNSAELKEKLRKNIEFFNM